MESTSTLEAPNSEGLSATAPCPSKRPLGRRILHLVRRTHLYLGLFLFPWAILYGVTGFLFNHPTFLADSPTVPFTRSDLVGTPLEHPPSPQEQAAAVVAALNDKQQPEVPYRPGTGQARYAGRDSFVSTVKAGPRSFFVVYDPKTSSGTIRETTPRSATADAPFATGKGEPARQRGMGMMGPMKHNPTGVKIEDGIPQRLESGLTLLLERKGFPTGKVTVTTAPDLRFPIEVDESTWTATYNPLTTTVTGAPGQDRSDLTFRAYLLRMHLARGYPGAVNTKWVWAVGVDAMALVLCFWGVSGLFMWWQIKATRLPGFFVLLTSAVAALTLAISMYGILS